eukprot:gb/GECG01009642.1/.p1 GENE.gb/GECG01009642.1/~~gb/GECG01009642.1/.p1  ORF type:complete len:147 (+),score=35.09 gb/GECG01009642.1/:1-441(+)
MAQQEGGAPKLRFRNYQPKHDDLSTYTAQSREAPSREVQKKITQQDQHRVQQQHQQEHLKASGNQKAAAANADFFQGQAQYQGDALEGAGGDKEDDPNITIAPKKENWDLKREIKPKLDRMEKQTQTAIAELVRERVENEVKEDNR